MRNVPARLSALACLLAVAGCGPDLVWRKPGATAQEFNTANYRCVRESNAAAPVDQRPTSVSSSSYSRSDRDRRRRSASGSQYVSYSDVNRGARNAYHEACMRAAGWRLVPREPTVAAGPAAEPGLCRAGGRVFAFFDGAWYPASAVAAEPGGCRVRYEDGTVETLPPGALLRWDAAGPGRAAAACRQGDPGYVFSEDGWYAVTVKADGGPGGCPVRYVGYGPEDDEVVPLGRLRRL